MANIALNKYATESDYENDSTRPTTISTVSLVTGTNNIHYDGVNVKRLAGVKPRVGDAVYVPTSSIYSAATPGSGVTDGSVTFIAAGTVNNLLMEAAGYTAIGTVVFVSGSKCYAMFKTIGGEQKFYFNAAGGDGGIPVAKLSDNDFAKITASDAEDTEGLIGYRATCSIDVLFAWLTGNGGASKDSGWNGGSNGVQNDFLNGADWGLTLGPGASSVTAHDAATYNVAETIAKFGAGEEGFKNYLESRRAKWPSSNAGNIVLFEEGKDATKVLTDANDTDNSAFFLPAQYAYNHNYTWGSYGIFANVDGLRRGDWFVPGLDIVQAIFKNVKYTLETTPTDVINRTQNAIGGSVLQLNSGNAARYWLPFARSRSAGWYLDAAGYFAGNGGMSSSLRSLSVAVLDV